MSIVCSTDDAECVSAGVLGVTDAVREISLDNSKVCFLQCISVSKNDVKTTET